MLRFRKIRDILTSRVTENNEAQPRFADPRLYRASFADYFAHHTACYRGFPIADYVPGTQELGGKDLPGLPRNSVSSTFAAWHFLRKLRY